MVGAGGAGMAPLALYLRGSGREVTACDDAFRQPVRELLLSSGVKVSNDPELTDDFDLVVFSSAVKSDHHLLLAAHDRGVPTLRRGHALAQVLADKKLVAVVGSHGKTTTTAMLAHLLGFSDISFGYLVGGFYQETGVPPARWSKGDWVVVEIDESDGTIEDFEPEITVALNCDLDHVDLYAGVDELQAAFQRLFARTRGKILVPHDHVLDRLARTAANCEVITFGGGGDFDATANESSQGLRILRKLHLEMVEEPVRAIGEFNGLNAIAALAACQAVAGKAPRGRLKSFPGLMRRQVLLRETPQRMIMEDYAHHPSELEAVLKRFRLHCPDCDLRVVFQPHRFSRQASLRTSFAEVLSMADHLYFLPTYGAGEDPIEEGQVDGLIDLLPTRFKGAKTYRSFTELSEAIGPASSDRRDCVLFLGAGDVERHAAAFSHLEATGWDRWLACGRYLRQHLSTKAVFRFNEPLSEKTTLRVGGKARLYCEPDGSDDVRELIIAARLFKMPLFVMGRGSNLIVPADGYEGIVLCMRGSSWRGIKTESGGRLVVGAAGRLKEICLFACGQGLAGFEFLEGIPGTLGGALRMNAGAMGGSIFDLVESVTIMTSDGERRQMRRDEFDARYRECPELKDAFVIQATLRTNQPREDEHVILHRVRSFAKSRLEEQPREASAGCIFRNPLGESAGRLIDEEGLKGIRVGAAEVSRKHGNFIVNRGGATSEDVVSLIRLVRSKVKETRGIELEPEVTLMGKSWEEAFQTNL